MTYNGMFGGGYPPMFGGFGMNQNRQQAWMNNVSNPMWQGQTPNSIDPNNPQSPMAPIPMPQQTTAQQQQQSQMPTGGGVVAGGGDSAMGPWGRNFMGGGGLPPNLGGGTGPINPATGRPYLYAGMGGGGQMYPGGNPSGRLPGTTGYGGQPQPITMGGTAGQMYPGGNVSGRLPGVGGYPPFQNRFM